MARLRSGMPWFGGYLFQPSISSLTIWRAKPGMAPCGSPTDMLIIERCAGGAIGAIRAFSRANGKSVSVSVRRGLNIETPLAPQGRSNAIKPAGGDPAGPTNDPLYETNYPIKTRE